MSIEEEGAKNKGQEGKKSPTERAKGWYEDLGATIEMHSDPSIAVAMRKRLEEIMAKYDKGIKNNTLSENDFNTIVKNSKGIIDVLRIDLYNMGRKYDMKGNKN